MSGTERPDPRFTDIDRWPTIEAVDAMVGGQIAAIASLTSQTAAIARAADEAAARLRGGSGRLVYVGAGTSGRIAVQDGVELGPTFGWPADRSIFLMAGGNRALIRSVEGAEDDHGTARARVAAQQLTERDVVIGVAASGTTPFTLAALIAARSAGALAIAIANNPAAPLLDAADFAVLADTGSEPVAGSTRMNAGTAQKAVLNILSTAIMLRLGRVYRGLMVDMVISNDKLRARAQGIVTALANCSQTQAIEALDQAENDIKIAVLVAKGHSLVEASATLARHGGVLRDAIEGTGCTA